jgi:hypothetical protein
MNRRTKYVGVLAQLALALALSGCGSAENANPGDDTHDEVGSVTEALTTQDRTLNAGDYVRLDWDGITMFVSTKSGDMNPGVTHVWSAAVDITNDNPARVHFRKLWLDLTCSAGPNGSGASTDADHPFSIYVAGNGGHYSNTMVCPWGFGYPYLVKTTVHIESSFGG